MRVLIVDNDHDIRELLVLILRMSGHAVEGVGDGKRALTRLREERFDLILLDLLMPGMGGLDFLEASRALNPGARVPVILTSAAPDLASLATTAGVDAVLPRPFEVDELLALVESVARVPVREVVYVGR